LHLDGKNIKKFMFDQFCIKMLLDSQIKNQIISLQLSKKNAYDTIQTLCSFFSLDEFSQLRSLTLIGSDSGTIKQISSMLPLLANLRYFRLTDTLHGIEKILVSLPASTIQKLSLPQLEMIDFHAIHQFPSIINLTISVACSIEDLCEFSQYIPMLEYLIVKRLYRFQVSSINGRYLNENLSLHHLKKLIVNGFSCTVDDLEILFKKTPNLKFLVMHAQNDAEISRNNARRWEHLITNLLPHLDVFRFMFHYLLQDEDDYISDELQQFQSDFWHRQHQWHTECVRYKSKAFIYTVPYISKEFMVKPYSKRYSNASINNDNVFHKVIDLTLYMEVIADTCEYHFPNSRSLLLENIPGNDYSHYEFPFVETKHIQHLKMIVNLCNVTHFGLSKRCRVESASILLHLLKEAQNISSLAMHKDNLFPLLHNHELCECLNKMIKKLDITGGGIYSFLDLNELQALGLVFSNMEQFRCNVVELHLVLILSHLLKFLHMKLFSFSTFPRGSGDRWLKKNVSQLDSYSFIIECEDGG
jgi:hypothetical protein